MDPAYLCLAVNAAIGLASVIMMWRATERSPTWWIVGLGLTPLLMLLVVYVSESFEREVSAIARYRPAFDPRWAREATAASAVFANFAIFVLAFFRRRLGRAFTIAAWLSVATFMIWVYTLFQAAAWPGPGG